MFYGRIATRSEAIRYAVERQSAEKLVATVVEGDKARFDRAAIRSLYYCDADPFFDGARRNAPLASHFYDCRYLRTRTRDRTRLPQRGVVRPSRN
jgi:hypothetical protein